MNILVADSVSTEFQNQSKFIKNNAAIKIDQKFLALKLFMCH